MAATTVIMSAGTKGGTGKSTYLTYLNGWYEEAGIEPYLIDADEESRTLSRFFPRARKIEPRRVKSYDVIVNLAETGEQPVIIADLKAGVGHDLLTWAADIPYEELTQLDVKFVFVGMITSSPDSVSSLLRWVDGLGRNIKWLVVKNLKDSDAAGMDPECVPFPEYDLTKQALEFRKKFRPATVVMPGLDAECQGELERMGITIRDVLARRPGVPDLLTSLIVRARLRRYQAYLYEQLDALKELLLP